jgi:hemolysin III
LSTPVAIATLSLVVTGGLLYTLGGVAYGIKKPNPNPEWFGFHEVFHTFTILALIAHYVGVSLASYALR